LAKWSHSLSPLKLAATALPSRVYYLVPLLVFLLALIVAQRHSILDPIPLPTSTVYPITMSKRDKFLTVFERIREELIDHIKSENMPDDAVTWFNEVGVVVPLPHHPC